MFLQWKDTSNTKLFFYVGRRSIIRESSLFAGVDGVLEPDSSENWGMNVLFGLKIIKGSPIFD